MTCPCRSMREAAAKAAESATYVVSVHPGTDKQGHDVLKPIEQRVKIADAIRALPLCGRCDTHVWVPREPTASMLYKGTKVMTANGFPLWVTFADNKLTSTDLALAYKAMLAAMEDK